MEWLEDRVAPAIFTVLNTADTGAGSLRQAILDANATVNVDNTGDGKVDPDLIHFRIPGAGVHTITSVSPGLPIITDPVVIDGYTQPKNDGSGTLASPNTNGPGLADNAELLIEIQHGVDLGSNGLVLGDLADGSTIRGLVIDGGFSIGILVQASDVHVEGCFIGVDPTGTTAHGNGTGISFAGVDTSNGVVGGTTPDKRNLISGNNPDIFIQSGSKHFIQGNLIGTDATGLVGLSGGTGVNIQGSNDNLIGGSTPAARNIIVTGGFSTGVQVGPGTGNFIQGNFIGTDITGAVGLGSSGTGIFIDGTASGTQVGGLTASPGTGPGNVISGSVRSGIQIGGTNNLIQGNLIGTDATGTKALGNGADGIQLSGSSNTVGGLSADARNVISAGSRSGIILTSLGGPVTGNLIQGNFIGTDITGTPNSMGNGEGVLLEVASGTQIRGNIIAGNTSRGVDVSFNATNNAILGNSIFANGGLGIDLSADGVTQNDLGDADPGPNNLQNFPELNSVSGGGGSTTITGTLNSTPGTTFRIEFFASHPADPSGFGEGQTFLGFADVTTNFIGNVSFAKTLPVGVSASQVVTATATDPNGNTSEFSAVHTVDSNIDLAVSQTDSPDPVIAGNNFTYQITVTNNSLTTATGVTLTDLLPPSTTLISSDHSFIQSADKLTFTLGNLAGGASTKVGIVVRRTLAGTFLNNVDVSANEPDLNTSNNQDNESTNILPDVATQIALFMPPLSSVPPASGFTISLRVADQFNNIATGYRGTVHFTSSDTAANVALPSDYHFTAADAGGHTFASGVTLRTNGTQTITVTDNDNGTLTDTEAILVAPNGPATFVVTNTLDSGPGSLRQAIRDSNTHTGKDTITFQIGNGPHTIFVGDGGLGALPSITDSAIIDGATQPGFFGKPLIELDGSNLGIGVSGLTITAGDSTVKGLAINGFSRSGIILHGSFNLITGNFLGTDLSGGVAKGNGVAGVELGACSSNTIGGTTLGARNIISGNTGGSGILIGDSVSFTVVVGNFIGTDYTGSHSLANNTGIEVHTTNATPFLGPTIGGTTIAARNVISGNNGEGVLLLSPATILGNFIGTDKFGTHALGNGVGVDVRAVSATIGGTTLGARNVISGNLTVGIAIESSFAVVQGNFIGSDVLGTHAVGNLGSGIVVTGGFKNLIGGEVPAARNVISGNASDGIRFFSADDFLSRSNVVQGNFIGTDVTGARSLGNQQNGVAIFGGAQNTIGGITLTARNIVSGNADAGILIQGADAASNLVQGNFIGVGASGTVKVANKTGIDIDQSASGNTIGGTVAGARNIISGNSHDGVLIQNGATGNVVEGDFIGTNLLGSASLVNGFNFDGIGVKIDAPQNTIGGTTAGAANVISGNAIGVLIDSQGTENLLQGNLVGVDRTAAKAVGNVFSGIEIRGSRNTIGGTQSGAGNLISGNIDFGVDIESGDENLVQGNRIGTDSTGTAAIGNGLGIAIAGGLDNTIGGTSAAARNIISGNQGDGIRINGDRSASRGNQVLGNYIGTDTSGNARLSNGTPKDGGNGVTILGRLAKDNIIGGTTQGAANIISGNATDGVLLFQADDNQVIGNLIGVTARGNKPLANGRTITVTVPRKGGGTTTGTAAIGNGVEIVDGDDNLIGGAAVGSRNVISGNLNDGVLISDGGSENQVQGNLIGTDDSGAQMLGNGRAGIEINDAHDNIIGGTVAAERNIVSGNSSFEVLITGKDAAKNRVQGNYIGTDVTGTIALPGQSSSPVGVYILGSAKNNLIGGTESGAGNLISGNSAIGGKNGFGILIEAGATGNRAQANLIGTDISGTHALPNFIGVQVSAAAGNNTIGGSAAGAGNVISGNTSTGVEIDGTQAGVIQGNFIGTDILGSKALPNGLFGIHVAKDADKNTIGGTSAGAGNVISGNGTAGVQIDGASSTRVQGNFIGTDLGGTFAVPNNGPGVVLSKASGTVLGGAVSGATNVISGNALDGVLIVGTAPLVSGRQPPANLVEGNLIGTDATGSFRLPNAGNGVKIGALTSGNRIGGAGSDAGNVISGNARDGVLISGLGATKNLVQGNRIGLDASGSFAVANSLNGVEISSFASGNTVGGADVGAGNVISGNFRDGVLITGRLTTGNQLAGNYIGTDITGTFAVRNGADGVTIADGASTNTIGGAAAGAGNVISGNFYGVEITSKEAKSNQVMGNLIGTDATGTLPIANIEDGVFIASGAGSNTIGGVNAGAGNVISGNKAGGVTIFGSSNKVQGNLIGTDATGNFAVPNGVPGEVGQTGIGGYGVQILGGATVVGGTSTGARNVISGNLHAGVVILNDPFDIFAHADGNQILGNFIGTDASGTASVSNGEGVVILNHATGTTIGGKTAGAGNLISGNFADASSTGIEILDGTGTLVQGNFIGTDVTGTLALPNGEGIRSSGGNTIGGTTARARNLISGNAGDGVTITAGGGNIDVFGNFIGTDVSGALSLGNAGNGVSIHSSIANNIGGAAAGAANVIAFNGLDGVFVDGSVQNGIGGVKNRISRNSIFSNFLMGIELTNNANDGQIAPHLASAALNAAGTSISIQGSVTGKHGKSFVIEFFASDPGDPQGKKYLGSKTVTIQTNNASNPNLATQNFTVSFITVAVSEQDVITATATDSNGNTSEFSNARVVR